MKESKEQLKKKKNWLKIIIENLLDLFLMWK